VVIRSNIFLLRITYTGSSTTTCQTPVDTYERQKMGFATWSEAATAARDRAGWRRQVNGPILPEEM